MDGFECLCQKQGKVNAHEICRSVRGGSWFEESLINLRDMKLTSLWFGKCKQNYERRVCGMAEGTLSDWYNFNREVYLVHM